MATSIFPISVRRGSTKYIIARSGSGMLSLERYNQSGKDVIYFPDEMLNLAAKAITEIHAHHEADRAVANMFHTPMPVWPNSFGEKS